jgi:diguanylate cyclase (GGDEF)-like protein
MRSACAALLALSAAGPAPALDPATEFGDYLLERWTAEDGLPQITVLTLAQDSEGYLWVGTQNGIARFDGRRFHNFTRVNTGLDLTMPTASLAEPEGVVWFGTPRGLLRQQAGRFEDVPIAASATSVRALQHWNGQLLAATVDGLRSPGRPGRPEHLGGESVLALAVDPAERLWAAAESGLFMLEQGRPPQRFPLPAADVRALALTVWQGALVLGSRDGVWRFDLASGAWSRLFPALAGIAVPTLKADRHGNLWAASVEHLQRLRPDGSLEAIGDVDFLPRPWLHVIFEDRDGDLWMGSQRESLLRISDSALRVISRRQALHDTLLWSVLDDGSGGLWVGSNGGLTHWRPERGFERVEAGDPLPDPAVYSLHRDPQGSVWLGTRAGLARLRAGRIEVDPAFAPLAAAQITSFADDGSALWIGSLDGLWRLQDGALARFGAASGTPDARVRSLLRQDDGSLLVGTEGGLRRLRGEHWDSPEWAQALEGSFVSSLRPLPGGALLLTTLDKGIAVYREGGLRSFGLEHGLPSANGWTSDLVGAHVYVSTNDGAYRLPLARLMDPDREAGLQAEVVIRAVNRARGDQRMGCCNGGGHARSARIGALLFYPTTNGLIRLDTARVQEAPDWPGLSIEAVEAGGTQLDFPARVSLDAPPRDLTIRFAGVSLRHANEVQFRYRLDGYTQTWKDAVGDRAVYTGLPPGDYRFLLEGRFPGRGWQRAPVPLDVRVVPAWHEQRSVHLAGGLALLALLITGWRHSLGRAERRRQALENAVRERTEALDRANERLRSANAALLEESRTDALTGCANRRAALRLLSEWPSYVLMLLDLDHFKALNDRYGHAAGDQVLITASALLRARLGPSALLARWGGEEFLVIWPGLELEEGLAEAEHLRATIAQAQFQTLGGQALRVTCSVGVARHPLKTGRGDWQLSLELADRALYRAKANGRNRVEGAQLDLAPGEALPAAGETQALDELARQGSLRFERPRVLRIG